MSRSSSRSRTVSVATSESSLIKCPSSLDHLKVPVKQGSVTQISSAPEGGPPIRLITKDLIRDLYVPRKDPPHLTAVLTPEKYGYLKQAARLITKEEKEAAIQKSIKDKDALREACQARKARIQELDIIRKQNEKLSELEEEAKQKAEYLLQKANQLRQEQEDEIKDINELIVHAKVQTIRNSQVVEKQLIKYELKKTEADLDAMMEKIRVEGLQEEEERARKRKEEAYVSAALLKEQIKDNEEARILKQEEKDREGEKLLQYMANLQVEDFQKLKEEKLKQKLLLESLLKEKGMIAQLRRYEKEQSRQQDRWIAEYQRQKADREEAEETELKEKKRQREIEIAKMRAQQEKAKDLQAEKDALRERRAQEEKEREWRRKEKERAIKEKETQEMLTKAHGDQIQLQDHLRILKAKKDQKEFKAMVEKNKFEMQQEELQRQAKRAGNFKYADDVRAQIREKEKERINERKEFFKEGVHLREEHRRRNERLENLKREKLNQLRDYDIPEVYLKHIERKVQLPPQDNP